jgi:hypothetical protein
MRIIISGFLLIFIIAACNKNEQAIEQERFTNLQLRAITVDNMLLEVTVDDNVLTDSLVAPSTDDKIVPVKYNTIQHRIRAVDKYTNKVMMDTVVNYQSGLFNTITLFQPNAGEKLLRIAPPASEAVPADSNVKISVVFSQPVQFRQQVLNEVLVALQQPIGSTYTTTDSFVVKRGEFSRYATLSRNKNFQFVFYTTGTPREPIIVSRYSLNTASSGFAIVNFVITTNASNITNVALTRLY